jgi:hypothetical protein
MVREQIGWFRAPNERYPQKNKQPLGDRKPFKPGCCELNQSSVFINRFGNLTLKKMIDVVPTGPGEETDTTI